MLPQPKCIDGRAERFLLGFLCGVGFCVTLGSIVACLLLQDPEAPRQDTLTKTRIPEGIRHLNESERNALVWVEGQDGPISIKVSKGSPIDIAKFSEGDNVLESTAAPDPSESRSDGNGIAAKEDHFLSDGVPGIPAGDEPTQKRIVAQVKQLRSIMQDPSILDRDEELPTSLPPDLLDKLDPATRESVQEATNNAQAQVNWVLAQARGEEVPDTPPLPKNQ